MLLVAGAFGWDYERVGEMPVRWFRFYADGAAEMYAGADFASGSGQSQSNALVAGPGVSSADIARFAGG